MNVNHSYYAVSVTGYFKMSETKELQRRALRPGSITCCESTRDKVYSTGELIGQG